MRLPRRPLASLPIPPSGHDRAVARLSCPLFSLGPRVTLVTAGSHSNNRVSSRFGLIHSRPSRARHSPPERRGPIQRTRAPRTLRSERSEASKVNADGAVWIEKIGAGMKRTGCGCTRAGAERMLRLAPWSAPLLAAIPPIVDAPVFALRKPARVVFLLDHYVSQRATRGEP